MLNIHGKVGFIGLGHMGKPMCLHLHQAGAPMTIHNRSQAVVEELAAHGMTAVSNPREVAEEVGAGMIILSLTNTECVRQVVEGPNGLFASLHRGSLIIDMSSTQVKPTLFWQAQAKKLGADWLDAPVSGGQPGAENATLTIMCGGNKVSYVRAMPLFQCLGKTVRHMGDSGAGQVAKLANQVIVASQIAAVSEAFTLAKAYGIDLAMLREALLGGFAASKILDMHGQRMIDGNFTPGGTATNQLKDVREARNVAARAGLLLPLLETSFELWERMIADGFGALDHSSLYHYYQTILNPSQEEQEP